MILLSLAGALFVCAAVPAAMFLINLRRYRPPQIGRSGIMILRVAVLIPARDEENNIGACVESVLANRDANLEVLVLDDASTDRTAEIVRNLARRDARVRLVTTQTLPAGWNGKQRACWLLAQETHAPLLLFLDADVRIAPETLSRCIAEMQQRKVALLSGFPRQITVGRVERMLLPLIHFVLLSFLPMGRMRKTTKTGYAAGCGQFFLADRHAYFASGGHAAIRETRHDGLRLPKEFRKNGFRTDIVDLTRFAKVRMYDSPRAVWIGLAKNATEGLGAPGRIVPLTVLLILGQILPVFAALLWLAFGISNWVLGATFDNPRIAWTISGLLAASLIASYLPRILAARRFKHPMASALLHPMGVAMLLGVQWYALVKQIFRRPVAWRARAYSSGTGDEIRKAQTHHESL